MSNRRRTFRPPPSALFNRPSHHWVEQSERHILSVQLFAYNSIIFVGTFYLFLGWSGMLGGIAFYFSNSVSQNIISLLDGIKPLTFLVALCMIITGRGLRNFRAWAWGLAVVCLAVNIIFVMAIAAKGFFGALLWLGIVLPLHVFLFTDTARDIFFGKENSNTRRIEIQAKDGASKLDNYCPRCQKQDVYRDWQNEIFCPNCKQYIMDPENWTVG